MTAPVNVILGQVFLDNDGNGNLDAGDAPTQSITVELYRDADDNGTLSSGDTLVATQATDANGDYRFEVASFGSFVITPADGALPAGSVYTTKYPRLAKFGNSGGKTDAGNSFGYQAFIDLSLTKSADKPTAVEGEDVIFTLTLQNDGPSDATGVQVTDLLPEGLELSSTPTNYTAETGVWNVGTLASGSSRQLTFFATVSTNPPGQIINTAEVTAAEQRDTDSTPDNRSAEPNEDDTASATLNIYRVSPNAGDIVINEVLFDQSRGGNVSAANNDEFIELYNAGSSPVDLSGWRLIDANLIAGDFDGPNGNINGTVPYTFPAVNVGTG